MNKKWHYLWSEIINNSDRYYFYIFFINFTISNHNTETAAKQKTARNCPAERGASFRNPLIGEYKIINKPIRVKMFIAHMILSFDKRLIEAMTLSVSELFTWTKNKFAIIISASPIDRVADAFSGFCQSM